MSESKTVSVLSIMQYSEEDVEVIGLSKKKKKKKKKNAKSSFFRCASLENAAVMQIFKLGNGYIISNRV